MTTFDGQRVSGRVGGSQRGGASARSAKSTSECACVRSMDCFLSAARWQSSASRGRRCGRAATHLRYDALSGQPYFWMRASSAASMAASASVPAAEEPGVPAMRGPVSSSSPASAWLPWASGLSTFPPLHPRCSPLRRQGSSHVETLPRQPFDSPECLRLSQGGLRLSRESFLSPVWRKPPVAWS